MSFVAIHAAQEAERQQAAEEEEMTRYTDEELRDGWEFKIVRSATREFHKPGVLSDLLEEEARAGWELVEKFDDQRIRLKRPRSAREKDDLLPKGTDPYRTQFGWSTERLAATILFVIFGLLLAVLGAVWALNSL
jgi:hypothetical protein